MYSNLEQFRIDSRTSVKLKKFLKEKEQQQLLRANGLTEGCLWSCCPVLTQLISGITEACASHRWQDALTLLPCIVVRCYPSLPMEYCALVAAAILDSGLFKSKDLERNLQRFAPTTMIPLMCRIVRQFEGTQAEAPDQSARKTVNEEAAFLRELEQVITGPSRSVKSRLNKDSFLRSAYKGLLSYLQYACMRDREFISKCTEESPPLSGNVEHGCESNNGDTVARQLEKAEVALKLISGSDDSITLLRMAEQSVLLLRLCVDNSSMPCEFLLVPLMEVMLHSQGLDSTLQLARQYVHKYRSHAPAHAAVLNFVRTHCDTVTHMQLQLLKNIQLLNPGDSSVLTLVQLILDNPLNVTFVDEDIALPVSGVQKFTVTEEQIRLYPRPCQLMKEHRATSRVQAVHMLVRLLHHPYWLVVLNPWQLLHRALAELYTAWIGCFDCPGCYWSRKAVLEAVTPFWRRWWRSVQSPRPLLSSGHAMDTDAHAKLAMHRSLVAYVLCIEYDLEGWIAMLKVGGWSTLSAELERTVLRVSTCKQKFLSYRKQILNTYKRRIIPDREIVGSSFNFDELFIPPDSLQSSLPSVSTDFSSNTYIALEKRLCGPSKSARPRKHNMPAAAENVLSSETSVGFTPPAICDFASAPDKRILSRITSKAVDSGINPHDLASPVICRFSALETDASDDDSSGAKVNKFPKYDMKRRLLCLSKKSQRKQESRKVKSRFNKASVKTKISGENVDSTSKNNKEISANAIGIILGEHRRETVVVQALPLSEHIEVAKCGHLSDVENSIKLTANTALPTVPVSTGDAIDSNLVSDIRPPTAVDSLDSVTNPDSKISIEWFYSKDDDTVVSDSVPTTVAENKFSTESHVTSFGLAKSGCINSVAVHNRCDHDASPVTEECKCVTDSLCTTDNLAEQHSCLLSTSEQNQSSLSASGVHEEVDCSTENLLRVPEKDDYLCIQAVKPDVSTVVCSGGSISQDTELSSSADGKDSTVRNMALPSRHSVQKDYIPASYDMFIQSCESNLGFPDKFAEIESSADLVTCGQRESNSTPQLEDEIIIPQDLDLPPIDVPCGPDKTGGENDDMLSPIAYKSNLPENNDEIVVLHQGNLDVSSKSLSNSREELSVRSFRKLSHPSLTIFPTNNVPKSHTDVECRTSRNEQLFSSEIEESDVDMQTGISTIVASLNTSRSSLPASLCKYSELPQAPLQYMSSDRNAKETQKLHQNMFQPVILKTPGKSCSIGSNSSNTDIDSDEFGSETARSSDSSNKSVVFSKDKYVKTPGKKRKLFLNNATFSNLADEYCMPAEKQACKVRKTNTEKNIEKFACGTSSAVAVSGQLHSNVNSLLSSTRSTRKRSLDTSALLMNSKKRANIKHLGVCFPKKKLALNSKEFNVFDGVHVQDENVVLSRGSKANSCKLPDCSKRDRGNSCDKSLTSISGECNQKSKKIKRKHARKLPTKIKLDANLAANLELITNNLSAYVAARKNSTL